MRVIVLDTETTGLSPEKGDRITEIGCVEMIDMRITGEKFHTYVNPERDVSAIATEISGLTTEFLKSHPVFEKVADSFLEFIGDSPLVIHNASFDMKFLNSELARINKPTLNMERAIDTVIIARKKFPGAKANLDALCTRFKIDLSKREKHGALIDSELLAEVYIELLGGRQKSLFGQNDSEDQDTTDEITSSFSQQGSFAFQERTFSISKEELQCHDNFITTLKNPLWNKFKKNAS